MKTIGVFGANGYVGKALYISFRKYPKYSVVKITRKNYLDYKNQCFDYLINCTMPSKRFWAKKYPLLDFQETVEKTAFLLYAYTYKKFIQISTISARCQPDTIYGKHKLASENLIDVHKHLIVRLGPMYSPYLKKGVLVDIALNKTVYVDGKSTYSFAPLTFCANEIIAQLDQTGIIEIGGKGFITLQSLAAALHKEITFSGNLDNQLIFGEKSYYPDTKLVIAFMKKYQARLAAS